MEGTCPSSDCAAGLSGSQRPGPRLGADVPVAETALAEGSQPRRLGQEAKCWSTLGATKAPTVLTESA